ncbi:DUF6944 family repetitive protein [Terrilactibacillus laevilacticus]|uniref:DUF6944 family repetitive protein n=1 Tax=Terrilactibacillus laevilacticus TaxID=1380157 RepID=A0ABW5PM47_9BACI|nr:hypothetical protein [Terrilactibacillus laevilacticus]
MDIELKDLAGSWTSALGTIVSAIGSTPTLAFTDQMRINLDLWGNVLQATGAGLSADAEIHWTLNKLGQEIQAIGNLTVVYGLVLPVDDIDQLKKNITGNWIQSLGSLVCFSDSVDDESAPWDRVGNLLQAIGNALQSIGGIQELHDPEDEESGEMTNFAGSWIQAIGAVMSALEQTKEIEMSR